MPRLTAEKDAHRQLAAQTDAAAAVAVADLLSFVNVDPAATDWHAWRGAGWLIHGDPATDERSHDPYWRFRELHQITTSQLEAAAAGSFSLTCLTPINAIWGYTRSGGVITHP